MCHVSPYWLISHTGKGFFELIKRQIFRSNLLVYGVQMTESETEYGPINTVIQKNGYFPRACQELIGKLDPFYSLRARDGLTTGNSAHVVLF
jgi:hypothetical protein